MSDSVDSQMKCFSRRISELVQSLEISLLQTGQGIAGGALQGLADASMLEDYLSCVQKIITEGEQNIQEFEEQKLTIALSHRTPDKTVIQEAILQLHHLQKKLSLIQLKKEFSHIKAFLESDMQVWDSQLEISISLAQLVASEFVELSMGLIEVNGINVLDCSEAVVDQILRESSTAQILVLRERLSNESQGEACSLETALAELTNLGSEFSASKMELIALQNEKKVLQVENERLRAKGSLLLEEKNEVLQSSNFLGQLLDNSEHRWRFLKTQLDLMKSAFQMETRKLDVVEAKLKSKEVEHMKQVDKQRERAAIAEGKKYPQPPQAKSARLVAWPSGSSPPAKTAGSRGSVKSRRPGTKGPSSSVPSRSSRPSRQRTAILSSPQTNTGFSPQTTGNSPQINADSSPQTNAGPSPQTNAGPSPQINADPSPQINADSSPQTTDSSPQTTGSSPQTTGSSPQTTDSSPQTNAGSSPQTNPGSSPQTTGPSPQTTGTRPQTNTGPSTQTNTGPSTQTNTGPSTQTNTGPSTQTNAGPSTQTNTGPSTQTNTGPSTQTNTGPSTQTNAGPSTQTNTGSSPQTNTGPSPQTNAGPSPQTNAGPSPQINAGHSPQTNAGPSPQTNTGPSPQTNAGPSPQTNAGPSPQINADPSPQANADPSPQINAGPSPQTNAPDKEQHLQHSEQHGHQSNQPPQHRKPQSPTAQSIRRQQRKATDHSSGKRHSLADNDAVLQRSSESALASASEQCPPNDKVCKERQMKQSNISKIFTHFKKPPEQTSVKKNQLTHLIHMVASHAPLLLHLKVTHDEDNSQRD
eukprot:gi/632986324/ref/XP_007910173.1/ PREDICTED: mucin-5AC-like [Callorhinchus milii]